MQGKKKENPKIEALIEHVDEILPVTAGELDSIAEHYYTFFMNNAEGASPSSRNLNQSQKGLIHWDIQTSIPM